MPLFFDTGLKNSLFIASLCVTKTTQELAIKAETHKYNRGNTIKAAIEVLCGLEFIHSLLTFLLKQVQH